MEQVAIQPSFAFVGHKYVQHGRCEWRERHFAQLHTYLTPETHDLPDATFFANGDSIHAEFKADVLSVRRASGSKKAEVYVNDEENESAGANEKKSS